ncbi:hypothetical protein HPB50_022791 [Hyalomma asiaticum]|uniref:Uncharacterized protein n=1 Tax=Hyalomma asiaticum TaxID=266040 RepID=A0ACB7TPI4_HYAAI|nr:hypothetical protein HPB50_022791 [Hyalomma asiaticum]
MEWRHPFRNTGVQEERKHNFTKEQRAHIMVSPLPRSVHPENNVGGVGPGVKPCSKIVCANPESARFVDAAQYRRSANFSAVTVDHTGSVLHSASTRLFPLKLGRQLSSSLSRTTLSNRSTQTHERRSRSLRPDRY